MLPVAVVTVQMTNERRLGVGLAAGGALEHDRDNAANRPARGRVAGPQVMATAEADAMRAKNKHQRKRQATAQSAGRQMRPGAAAGVHSFLSQHVLRGSSDGAVCNITSRTMYGNHDVIIVMHRGMRASRPVGWI